MRVLHGIDGLRDLPTGSVMSVGNFDGLHRGHGHLLHLCRHLKSQGASSIAAVTFEPHPLTVLRPNLAPPRLTPIIAKHELLQEAGVDSLVELAPSHDVLDLSAEAFWTILRDVVRPAHLIEGRSFTFGKDRKGTIARLQHWCADGSIKLHIVEAVTVALLDLTLVPITSSIIRWLIANGRVRDAAICLGRPYVLRGEVVKGFQRGRTIGIPTANLKCPDQLTPADGVYAGRCAIDGTIYPAAVSIGPLPTFDENVRQIEAHLIGYSGDLYGQTIDLQLVDWLRDQRRFAGVDSLKAQLERDIQQSGLRASEDASRPIAAVLV